MIDIDITEGAWPEELVSVAETAALTAKRHINKPDAQSIAVRLSDDEQVRTLNHQFRNRDKATNVLSFPASPPMDEYHAGDIILAYETCVAEAEAQKKPLTHHLMHLVVHGVLHLYGYDHMIDTEAEQMECLETQILNTLDVPNPYA